MFLQQEGGSLMRESLNDKLEAFFKAHPNTWIHARELMDVAGAMAWRTRVSNLRKRGLTIENKLEHAVRASGGECYLASFYRYVPPVEHTVDAQGQGVLSL